LVSNVEIIGTVSAGRRWVSVSHGGRIFAMATIRTLETPAAAGMAVGQFSTQGAAHRDDQAPSD
jgi:hypothetical protein